MAFVPRVTQLGILQFVGQHIWCFENENPCWILEGEFMLDSSRIWG
jgi:hypothetical protein